MATFIIKRHGSNAANQHLTQTKVLGTVEATDSEEAKRIAADRWTCYNNQHFEAIDLAGRTRKADREAAAEADTTNPLEWTLLDGREVILTAGMIDGSTGQQIFGLFASEEDARSLDVDQLALGTVTKDRLTTEQVQIAERNSARCELAN